MKHTRMGIVSFVNNGNNMLGSQFFITLGDALDYLDDKHTIFGQVTEGLDTLEKLNEQLCDDEHRPFKDIRIAHTIVLDDPFEDPKRLEYPRRSPSPTFEMLVKTNQIALDENIDDMEGKTAEEIAEEIKKREMAEQAQILEMVGDLRHADEAPPDNVLFVCKLNPVTTDEDLEIIFSRFGKIIKCEVIRDRRTQQSLQYAFIEFEDPKSCEQAFFKMDNVLIDDRRIHVDFSQSVAKLHQWDRGSHIVHRKGSHAHRKENRDHPKENRDRLEGNAHRREMGTMNVGEETNHKNAVGLLSAEENEVQKGKDEKGRGRATMIYRRNFAETEALRSPEDVPEAESDRLEEMSAREAENEHERSKGGTDRTAETSEEEAENGDPAAQKSDHVAETNRVHQAGKSTGNRILRFNVVFLFMLRVVPEPRVPG
ncbi:hypothetical protein OESDEN_13446 [Oesophagostomum dentatum]|uniref:Peptidyl-prolyl cis-trans isomerase n=1 Tax=Oesophagostomum dentatum TaxID=61180 RepID=A0A0B1SPB0_OESDE|nr:hypothetical protein OESDEN_13446 [Oesophagostomum dentatum]